MIYQIHFVKNHSLDIHKKTNTYALSVDLKMKPLRKSIFQFEGKNQPKFCRKTYWKEQPFIFTVYLSNHIFQASVLFNKW